MMPVVFARLSHVSPGCPLLVHHGATGTVAMDTGPWAVAIVGVSRCVAAVACSRRVVVAVVMVVSGRRNHLFPVVVVSLSAHRNTHFGVEMRIDGLASK